MLSKHKDELKRFLAAEELIKHRLRVPVVAYMTAFSYSMIRQMWKNIHGERPKNGRLPESVAPFLKSHINAAQLSSFVSIYNAIDCSGERTPNAETFLHALRIKKMMYPNIEPMAAYYAVRDVRAELTGWHKCPHCNVRYIKDLNSPYTRSCPFCSMIGLQDRKIRRPDNSMSLRAA